MNNKLKCQCGASARDNSKERGRFNRRHPLLCGSRESDKKFTKQLAEKVRSVPTRDLSEEQ